MRNLELNYENVLPFISEDEINQYAQRVKDNHNKLHNKTGKGAEFTDWITYPMNYDKGEYARLKKSVEYIKANADALIVLGIGGSYLGARAVIEALTPIFKKTNSETKVYFAGNNISSKYIKELVELIKNKDICINVISKSGNTLETSLAFRIFKDIVERKYGIEESRKRIFVTTDNEKGLLKYLATEENYETFTVPNGISGRFSVLTSVGLLPIAVTGIDIDEIMHGAEDMANLLNDADLNTNIAYKYAVLRNILYSSKGKKLELLVNYEPYLVFFSNWTKQLYNESEGKEGKGLYLTTVSNTTDLHSIGQYIQEGERIMFETVLNIENDDYEYIVKKCDNSMKDGLDYLEGMTLYDINHKAMEATIIAHVKGKVPNILIRIPKLNEYYMGQMLYFFETAIAMSGYLLDINPFNQPGVEDYKANMFRLLGKPE